MIKKHGSVTFAVEPGIEPAGPGSYGKHTGRMREPRAAQGLAEAWKTMGGTVEAMSAEPPGTVATFTKQNLLAKAVHAAFYGHHPLVLSPDVIWLTIAQGLANHVDQHAEALRSQFVSHEGKKEIVIQRPEFVKGSPDNDWEGVFPEFSELIAANTAPGTVELIEGDFSTTGPVEKIVSHITLMDTVQHYFSYTMCCGCGFPSITLSGTPADWEKIRAKAEALRRYDLDWWLDALLPALDEFVNAANGRPNLNFWRSLCNINTGTSFPCYEPLTGWIQVFFPYLNAHDTFRGRKRNFEEAAGGQAKKQLRVNSGLGNYAQSMRAKVNLTNFAEGSDKDSRFAPRPKSTGPGIKLELFPPAMSSAPFKYVDLQFVPAKTYQMAFCGGITTLVQHPDGAIEPRVGWAVLDSGQCTSAPQVDDQAASSSTGGSSGAAVAEAAAAATAAVAGD